jgi:hypothetical protein
MKIPAGLRRYALPMLLVAQGCASERGINDPTEGKERWLASAPYSSWSSPVNLGAPVNSAATDQHPALSKDGLSLYFASNRTGDQNIWVTQRACTDNTVERCAWSQPVMLGGVVNSQYLDAAPTLSRDEHQLFFASQRSNGHCSATLTSPCDRDLWVSYRDNVQDDLGWQPAVNLAGEVNTPGEEVAPSYFENADLGLPQLFFNDGVVNDAGILTLGNIYVSELTLDGTWGEPSPVDEPAEDPADLDRINTTFSDQRPSVSHDGQELYFHSARPLTVGGAAIAHIWVATRQRVSDPWSAPTLVPSPISDAQTIHPFIHSQGKIQTLFFVRGGDLWMSERTRLDRPE